MAWTFAFHEAAEAEFLAQPADIQARFERIKSLVGAFGLERLPGKYAKHLRGPLWEFRLNGRDGIARALYVALSGQRIVVVSVFTKKSDKTPRGAIDLGLQRAREVS
ncbi:MAG: type II toxin-antitoxin system RelE/ParE family toxin [Hyphomicrobium sp.]